MENFSVGDDGVKVRVREEYYSEDAVEETLEVFQQNFEIEQEEGEDYVIFTLAPKEEGAEFDEEELALEFFNHLLSNEKGRISIGLS
ncbi:MAG: hypothetical protein MUP63_04175 [Candidatus Nanohaloarchaeota archaeon QJJ-7]|nr:hypothetical protein [Candidatus Nanohaloarchaeota archaeon QJJ-7]